MPNGKKLVQSPSFWLSEIRTLSLRFSVYSCQGHSPPLADAIEEDAASIPLPSEGNRPIETERLANEERLGKGVRGGVSKESVHSINPPSQYIILKFSWPFVYPTPNPSPQKGGELG